MSDHPQHDGGTEDGIDDVAADALLRGEVPAGDPAWGRTAQVLGELRQVAATPIPQVTADAHLAAAIGAIGAPDDVLAARRAGRLTRKALAAGIIGAGLVGGAAAAMGGAFDDRTPPSEPVAVVEMAADADAAVAVAMEEARAEGAAAPGLAGGEPPGQAVADGDGPTTGRPVCPDDERGVGVGDENRATDRETGPCNAPGMTIVPGEPSTTAPGQPDDVGRPDDDNDSDSDSDSDSDNDNDNDDKVKDDKDKDKDDKDDSSDG